MNSVQDFVAGAGPRDGLSLFAGRFGLHGGAGALRVLDSAAIGSTD